MVVMRLPLPAAMLRTLDLRFIYFGYDNAALMAFNRRRFLGTAAGTIAGSALSSCQYWPDKSFLNPCRAELPPHLARHELVRAAWEGIDPALMWDCHVHIAGTGDSGPGIWMNPRMQSVLNPMQYAQRMYY